MGIRALKTFICKNLRHHVKVKVIKEKMFLSTEMVLCSGSALNYSGTCAWDIQYARTQIKSNDWTQMLDVLSNVVRNKHMCLLLT